MAVPELPVDVVQRTATTPVLSAAVPLMVSDGSEVEKMLEPGRVMASAGGVRSGTPGAGSGVAGGDGGGGGAVGG
jgi:hypothetical protein